MEYEIPNGIRYVPDADQRGYRPPEPTEPFHAPKVSASANYGAGEYPDFDVIANANKAFQKFIDATSADRDNYTADGFQNQLAQFKNTDAARAVDPAVERAQTRLDQAKTKKAKIRASLSPDGDTAAELRAGRYWDRTKPLLDSAKDGAFSRAQKLIAEANREELGVLLQELPAYLEAHGTTTDWIDAAVGQAIPEYADATAAVKDANEVFLKIRYAAKSVREGFDEGRSANQQALDILHPNVRRQSAIATNGRGQR